MARLGEYQDVQELFLFFGVTLRRIYCVGKVRLTLQDLIIKVPIYRGVLRTYDGGDG